MPVKQIKKKSFAVESMKHFKVSLRGGKATGKREKRVGVGFNRLKRVLKWQGRGPAVAETLRIISEKINLCYYSFLFQLF